MKTVNEMAGAATRPVRSGMETALGVSLTAVAGYVGTIGYLVLGGLFASFMSGSSVLLGVAISDGRWATAFEAALLISVFVAGAIVATVLAGLAGIWALAIVLLLEGGLLAGATFLAANGWEVSQAIIAVVAAMGVQNTALRPRNRVRLGATFMTGTLVSLSQGIGEMLLGRGGPREFLPHALLWLAFTIGAGAGAWFYAEFGFIAVSGPAAATVAMALIVLFDSLISTILSMRRKKI